MLPTAVEGDERYAALPDRTVLLPAYPNPFNPAVWIPYELAQDSEVEIRIYNIAGQQVRTLELGRQPAGRYFGAGRAAYWDSRNSQGTEVASGVYFYVLRTGSVAVTRKMVLLK